MTDPSFYYAIFKKLQASCGSDLASGYGHLNDDTSDDLAGGFSLRETQGIYGLYKSLQPGATGAAAGSPPTCPGPTHTAAGTSSPPATVTRTS